MHALSLKQPWATLLAHGLKTIEIRRWPTARLDTVLIHAARVPDERHEGWKQLPEWLQEHASLVGGFVGAGKIIECKRYTEQSTFLHDRSLHLCPAAWFDSKSTFGFVFDNLRTIEFHAHPGWMRFFSVPQEVLEIVDLP